MLDGGCAEIKLVRVLVVSRSGWPFPAPPGGAETVALRQSIALAQAGVAVTLVGQGSLGPGALAAGVRLVNVRVGRTIDSTSQAGYFFKVLALSIMSGIRAAAQLRQNRSFDVVHCHHSTTVVALRFLAHRTPVVLTVHDNPYLSGDATSSLLERVVRVVNNGWLESIGVRLADHVVAVSPEIVQRLMATGCPAAKITEIWPTAPTRADGPPLSGGASAGGLPNPAPFLLTVGDLTRRKRMDIVVRALSFLPPEVHLVVVGRGPGRADLEGLVVGLGLADRVSIRGYVDESTLRVLQRTAAVAVLASEREGLPTTLLEALAEGTPAVYATTQAVALPQTEPYLVHVKTESPTEVAGAVARLLSANSAGLTKEEVQSWARTRFPSTASVAQTLLGLYRQILLTA